MTVRIADIRLDGLLFGRRLPKSQLVSVPLPEVGGPISNACTAKNCGVCTPKEHTPSFAMRWQAGEPFYDASAYSTVPYGQKGGPR